MITMIVELFNIVEGLDIMEVSEATLVFLSNHSILRQVNYT